MGESLKKFSDVQEMGSIRDLIRFVWSTLSAHELFYGHGTDNAWDEACHLVLSSLKLPWDVDNALLDCRVTQAEKERVAEFLQQRVVERKPLPYITGEAWFMGLPFEINAKVLIPRSPLAELLQKQFDPWIDQLQPLRILDLCCGSGCIGIAAASVFEDAEVVLSDIDPEALALARRNIERFGLQDRVQVVESDLFDQLAGPFDLILTNPPYVDAEDMDALPAEYRHEPVLALASGEDGLDCARRILAQSGGYLSEDGWLVGEVGNSIDALLDAFPGHPFILPDFEWGGSGVFILSAADLKQEES